MADNAVKYGFRLVRMRSGFAHASQEEAFCVSGQAFSSGVLSNASLRPGDPIVRLASGGVTLAPGTDGTPGDILGVVVGVKQYYDTVRGGVTQLGNAVPSGLAYGTNLDLQTKVYYIPAEAGVWAIQVNDAVTATTKAAYQLLVGTNANHVYTATTGLALTPKLNISTSAVTATLGWRIIGLGSDTNNVDYAGANVELYVTCNRPQMFTGAGTAWQGI